MSAPRVQPRTTRIRDMEAHLKWRRRTEGRCLVAMSVAFGLVLVFGFPTVGSKPFSGKDLLVDFALFVAVLGFVFGGIAIHVSPLFMEDVRCLLESDEITAVPILAEYHDYFSVRPGRDGRKNMDVLRTRVIELLRSRSEAPKLEFLGSRLVSIIRMIAYVDNQEDRFLLFSVIAKSGVPADFGEIDLVVRNVCRWELRNDEPAKVRLKRMAIDCKAAIRAGYHTVQETQSLLRPTHASDGLLSPSSQPKPVGTIDSLLHSSAKPDE
jgi:hypothetical protein